MELRICIDRLGVLLFVSDGPVDGDTNLYYQAYVWSVFGERDSSLLSCAQSKRSA
jgi:hypothetical protein